MGLNGVDNGRLWFENVRVPHSALLDRFGHVTQGGQYESPIPSPSKRFFSMLGTLIGGRVNVAGGALSASKVALTIALRYAAMRRQFPDQSGVEQPLLEYLSHRARLLPGVAYAYAFSFAQAALLQRLTADGADPEHQRSTEALAAGLKAIGTWRALDTLQKCRECCGGQGYLTTNRLDPLRTDADVFTTFEGDNTVLCQQLAKELLRESMSRAQQQGSDKAPAKPAAPNAAPTPAPKLKGAEALLEGKVQLQALQFRERMLLETLNVRIERRLEQGVDPQGAFESCQDHVLALAKARMECFVLEAFQAAVAKEPLLGELCTLYALSCIEEDVGVFLEHEYLAPPHARALRDMRRELLGRCAARALDYTAAFGIPEHCLGPLADRDYVEASGLAEAAKNTAK
jgi:acyl-CoA oxidase